MKFKHFFGLLFAGMLLFIGYNLWVFGALAPIDRKFEINTHFLSKDLHDWLAPQRNFQLLSRWRENRTTDTPHSAVRPSVLNDCILSESPCVDMLEEIAPSRPFWKTGADIIIEKQHVQCALNKAIKSGKLKTVSGMAIKTREQYIEALKQEQALLQETLNSIPWYYRYSCGLYNLWNYTPAALFTILHYSHIVTSLPDWMKHQLNRVIAWFMEHQYGKLKEETTTQVKKKTFRIFHWLVESKVNKAFNKIQSKAEKHTYIHDYSPYYHKLQYEFDLDVKNIYNELLRLIERNQALQELATTSN